MTTKPPIILKNVKVHNLKGVNLKLIPDQLIVFTGVSGSGKSSLAFDTIYVEGQRRYVESLSTYARRYMGDLTKPEADLISGISPTIAIEQKTVGKNPRSTVGTLTGAYDFLRVLFAKIAIPYCPVSGEALKPQSQEQILHQIKKIPEGTKVIILSPFIKGKKGTLKDDIDELIRKGFTRIRLDGKFVDLTETIEVNESTSHDIDLVIDRIVLNEENLLRVKEATLQALELGKGVLSLHLVDKAEDLLYSQFAFSQKSNLSYPPLEPQDFSFNHPSGMCPNCEGLGITQEYDLTKILDPKKSIREDCCSVAGSYNTVRWKNIYDNLAEIYSFDIDTPWEKLNKAAQDVFLYGNNKKWTRMRFVHPEKGSVWYDYIAWKGVLYEAKKRFQEAKSDFYRDRMAQLMHESTCESCRGSRLKPYPSSAKLQGKTIQAIAEMPLSDLITFLESISLSDEEKIFAEDLLKEVIKRLHFLMKVGLHYLSLERTAPTLSGGEGQRVRLASQIGSGLVGTTYILDEPSIGLHQRDNSRLIETLRHLRNLGNTVIVIEHDEETIFSADHVVDVGPGAGEKGGHILYSGPAEGILKAKNSVTADYLTQKKTIPIPKKRSCQDAYITIKGASHHNLKNIDVNIPLGVFVCITGVSGSGKSSLISDILSPALSNHFHSAQLPVGPHIAIEGFKHLDKVIGIDQSPIGRTPRSNPSTYIKLFDDIRDLFANLKESQAAGYKAGRFSFNVLEGSCVHCKGMGMNKVDMDFMEDAWVTCSICQGRRFDSKTLDITFKGKNIYDILEMPIEEALTFFDAIPHIKHKLSILHQVGLGYMRLGQSSTTLSGGEAQRIKLAKELVRPSTGKTLYILDEPTTGLHFEDIARLINILQTLVSQGNSVIVIEHNLDLIKTCDWIIDMGPEGGSAGGKIIAEGPPETLIKKTTPTAIALKKHLKGFTFSEYSEKNELAPSSYIIVENAEQNNLKGISLSIPQGKITVCTGPSGSGKSSFAFETLYAEGQRRYVESLSTYARQFVKQMPKAKVDHIEGLSPAIAIEQKHHAGNPRSTIGTMTEIYDYLRVLYARIGIAYCPETHEKIETISKEFVANKLLSCTDNTKLVILSPIPITKAQSFDAVKDKLQKEGFLRVRLNSTYYELDEAIPFDPMKKNDLFVVIDRVVVKDHIKKRLLEAISAAAKYSSQIFTVDIDGKDMLFNLAFAVPSTGKSYPPLTPQTFSYNAEEGMCPECEGLGIQWGGHLMQHDEFAAFSPHGLIIGLLKDNFTKATYNFIMEFLLQEKIDPDEAFKDMDEESIKIVFNGSKKPYTYKGVTFYWKGLNNLIADVAKMGDSETKKRLQFILSETTCRSCQGERLKPLSRKVEVNGITLPKLCELPITDAVDFINHLVIDKEHQKLLDETLEQLKSRLGFLCKIGLDYLSLFRSAPSLSGGETQRIYLARQLGSGLTGSLYVLDEPTIGLHPYNNKLLNDSLIHLRNLGNTLVLVEHDPLTMKIADHIIDFGPGAGKNGGQIIAEGSYETILQHPTSLTGMYLSKKKVLTLPSKRRDERAFLSIKHAHLHNLKNLSVNIKTGVFTCVTGVSGSGKSSLILHLLKKALEKDLKLRHREVKPIITDDHTEIIGAHHFDNMICIDQNPIGHTNRADVSTYTDLLTPLRTFFSKLPLAQTKGLQPKHFSYNHKKGMCKTCYGLGYKNINLQFLPPVKVACDACKGYRLNPLSLEARYKGKNLGELLKLTAHEAKEILPPMQKIQKILSILEAVGLGYLELGQEIATLSGGEAQRLRLAKELLKRNTGKTLYLFDEPSIGLHFEDISKLLRIFHQLVDQGNTLIVIEHNLDIIAQADDIIDLGPKGGQHGGELVAQGTPEELCNHPTSLTGKFLKEHLA